MWLKQNHRELSDWYEKKTVNVCLNQHIRWQQGQQETLNSASNLNIAVRLFI